MPIDRAEQGVKALEQAEKAIYFLSNNATRSVDELGKKFAKYEIKLDLQQQFITPAHSIVDYLKGINFDKSIYLIGSSVLAEHLRAHNFEVVTGVRKGNCDFFLYSNGVDHPFSRILRMWRRTLRNYGILLLMSVQ